MRFIVGILLTISAAFAKGFPDCSSCDPGTHELSIHTYLRELSSLAGEVSYRQYFNLLKSSPDFMRDKLDCSELGRKNLRLRIDEKFRKDVSALSEDWIKESKTCGLVDPQKVNAFELELVAELCGQPVQEKNCNDMTSVQEFEALMHTHAEDLRLIDSEITKLGPVIKRLMCTKGEVQQAGFILVSSGDKCFLDGKALSSKDSENYAKLGQAYNELTGRKRTILNRYPALGLSGIPGTKFEPRQGFWASMTNAFTNVQLKDKGRRVYERLSSFDYGPMKLKTTDQLQMLTWAHEFSRLAVLSVPLVHMCDEGNFDNRIALELVANRSPLALRALGKMNPLVICAADDLAEGIKRKEIYSDIALGLSSVAVGVAAVPNTAGNSLGLAVAGGSAIAGAFTATKNTKLTRESADRAKILNQACLGDYRLMLVREAEAAHAETEAVINYAMESVALVGEGLRLTKVATSIAVSTKRANSAYQLGMDGRTILKGRKVAEDAIQRADEISDPELREAFIRHLNNLRNYDPEPPGIRQAEWYWLEYLKKGKNNVAAMKARIPRADVADLEDWYVRETKALKLCGERTPCSKNTVYKGQIEDRRKALLQKLADLKNHSTVGTDELHEIDLEFLELNEFAVPANLKVSRNVYNLRPNSSGSVKVLVAHELDGVQVGIPYSGIAPSDLRAGVISYDDVTGTARSYRTHDYDNHAVKMAKATPKDFVKMVDKFDRWSKKWRELDVLIEKPEHRKILRSAIYYDWHEFGDEIPQFGALRNRIRILGRNPDYRMPEEEQDKLLLMLERVDAKFPD